MFETSGTDLAYVRAQPATRVWTLVDGDSSPAQFVCSGFHTVNRVGYFVTEQDFDAPLYFRA